MKNNQKIQKIENQITNIQQTINIYKQELVSYENLLKSLINQLTQIKQNTLK